MVSPGREICQADPHQVVAKLAEVNIVPGPSIVHHIDAVRDGAMVRDVVIAR
jgi:hypothetical protein